MGQYKTSIGQNIYDIALHIYGSLDGLTDLLINNPSLSLSLPIKPDTLLTYTDNLFVNSNVVSTLISNNVTPANGSADIYYKEDPSDRIIDIICKPTQKVAEIGLSGNGVLLIDWGDNSDIQEVTLQSNKIIYQHVFKNKIKQNRKIKFFGSVQFIDFDISNLDAINMFFLKNINIEKYIHCASKCEIEHLRLCDNVYHLSLNESKISNLSPLIQLNNLITLDLTSKYINNNDIENYLIGLVNNYGNRRCCTIIINSDLNGIYREPSIGNDNKYIVTSAMEAVWVLVNEPDWQEGGFWHIIIKQNDYTSEGNIDVVNFFTKNLAKVGILIDKNELRSVYNNLHDVIKKKSNVILLPLKGKTGVVYGVDNINGSLAPFNFSRSSSATLFDKDQNMQLVGNDIPRIDYGNYTNDAKLLIEKQSTNLFIDSGLSLNSEMTGGAYSYVDFNWAGSLLSSKAAELRKDTVTSFFYKIYAIKENTPYSVSIFASLLIQEKPIIGATPSSTRDGYLNLSGGGGDISTLFSGKNVYRFARHRTSGAAMSWSGLAKPSSTLNRKIYVSGYQLEEQEIATSYIPTTTTTATRAADLLSYTLSHNSSIYLKTSKREIIFNKSEGVWNIHDDLLNEGIEELIIFYSNLSDAESLELLNNPVITYNNGKITNYDLSKSLLSVSQIRLLLQQLLEEDFDHNSNIILHCNEDISSISDLIQVYNSNFISIIIQ